MCEISKELSKSLYKSADARPGNGRCFMSQTATDEKRRVFAEVHTESLYFTCEDQTFNYICFA